MPNTHPEQILLIKKLNTENINAIKICAEMMANSEPWITLGRDHEASIQTLSDKRKEVFVAYKDDEIAAFIILNMQGAFVGYIQTLCVSSEQRGQGIGTQLLEFAEERIFSEFPNVFMCVSSFNTEAQKLYQKLGYEIIGELKDFIISNHSEILLRKTISSLSEFRK